MAYSIGKLQTQLMREYYKYFSKYAKGRVPEKKVAWVTSFAPIEILEALDMLYYYPESYAAVIAASQKEDELLNACDKRYLTTNCCSYACCIEGMLEIQDAPRGLMPLPDILIATNNQCNTLPEWWNIVSIRYGIPLVIIDYPGENVDSKIAREYVDNQHLELIDKLEQLTGNKLDNAILEEKIKISTSSIDNWNRIIGLLSEKEIKPTVLFDDISYLITARCKPETVELYSLMHQELSSKQDSDKADTPIYWLGYPLWYHPDRYLREELRGCRVVGANYLTWWSLDFSGNDVFERLFNAYNYTFLNLCQNNRDEKLNELIKDSGAKGVVAMKNKSCKCDFVSAKNIELPQASIEMDMIDRNFMDVDRARELIELMKDCIN